MHERDEKCIQNVSRQTPLLGLCVSASTHFKRYAKQKKYHSFIEFFLNIQYDLIVDNTIS
jgi:hypothetical protein